MTEHTDQKKICHFVIHASYQNERLDQTLAKLMPDYSRTQIKGWIENEKVTMHGKPLKAKTKLKGGEEIMVEIVEKKYTSWQGEAIDLPIVYEDEAILVINKPVGMVVHPGAGNKQGTLLNALLHHYPALLKLPRAGILHRLDKDTSGLLVIAKTREALHALTKQLQKKALHREYRAIVTGTLISGGTVNAPIGRHPLNRKKMSVLDTGKPAVTHYRVNEKYRDHTLLNIHLETGRTHQIRVHMAYIKKPIVGDPTYGKRLTQTKGMNPQLLAALRSFKHQALHAYKLGFIHPLTQQAVFFEAPLPKDMQELIKLLKATSKA